MHRLPPLAAFALLGALGPACENADPDLLGIHATGVVVGSAYIDRDGDGEAGVSDPPARRLRVVLRQRVNGSVAADATTDTAGFFRFNAVPVGDYELGVDTATLGDSLRVARIDSARVRVVPFDTVATRVAVTFPSATINEARALPAGQRVLVEGVALNAWTAFGDSTLHLADSAAAIRAVRTTPGPVTAGERVRVLATTASDRGQPVLRDGTTFVLGPGAIPTPEGVTTAVAATAAGGRLDAAQVRITDAAILGSETRPEGEVWLTVDDGSGRVTVVLDQQGMFRFGDYVPGGILRADGLLVPAPDGAVWRLRPRSLHDLIVRFPTVSIAEARTMPAGKVVNIEGVALTGWATFGDATVHLADGTGALRAVGVEQAPVFEGDSIRLLGTLALRDGQTVLSRPSASIFGPVDAPGAKEVTTAAAAGADAAKLDAALTRVVRATIQDTATVEPLSSRSDFRLTVDDGSGPLGVILDPDAGFAPGTYQPGATVTVTGVLVTGSRAGVWVLKPRRPSDLVVH